MRIIKGILEGAPILATMLIGLVPTSALATTFTDNFDRPNGPVGNGWSPATDQTTAPLVISDGALTTVGTGGGSAEIYRPISYTGSVTASAEMTQESGYYGDLLGRYVTDFDFYTDGTLLGGYVVQFARGDDNYTDSNINLQINGVVERIIYTPFQFGPAIFGSVTVSAIGDISGFVRSGGQTFDFDLGLVAPIPGQSGFGITLGIPNPITTPYVSPTLDNLTLIYDYVPEPSAWALMSVGLFLPGAFARMQTRVRRLSA